MNNLKTVRMDDHSIIMAISAIIGALGIKEVWGIIQKKMDIGAKKDEREENLYTTQIINLTEKINQLELKIDDLITENTHLKIKIVKMENRIIKNAKNKVQTRRYKDEESK